MLSTKLDIPEEYTIFQVFDMTLPGMETSLLALVVCSQLPSPFSWSVNRSENEKQINIAMTCFHTLRYDAGTFIQN